MNAHRNLFPRRTLTVGSPRRTSATHYRIEGVSHDPDGAACVDRIWTYVWQGYGKGSLSVAWPDGTVAPLAPRHRAQIIRAARKAIDALIEQENG